MNFELTEEQAMIRAAAKDFAEKEIAPLAKELNRNNTFPVELIKKMGKLGFLGLILPTKYGGGGASYISYCVFLEEIARADMGTAATASAHQSLCAHSIDHWGTEEQKQKYLPRLCSGEILGFMASTEPDAGSDVAGIQTMATPQGDGWLLNGNKMWITNGSYGGVGIVIAQTQKGSGSRGLTAFLLEKNTPGFTSKAIHNKLGLHSSDTAELAFDNCRIPKDNLLGPVGKGMSVALSAFDCARLGVAARSVGAAQACVDACVTYSQTRKQFGKPIGNFQLVQELIADMTVETEAARLLTYRAATMKDNTGDPATIETSMAKYYASEMVQRVAHNAIQIHGSYGYSDEYPIERIWRDARIGSILEGTSQVHKLIIGRAKTGFNAFS
jgi:alkylation response protein AidB-like acyl-CoA dehydrogenase